MAQLDFFAVREDLRSLVGFLLAETDIQILEHSSLPNSDLRRFHSVDALDEAVALGTDRIGSGFGATLALWSPSVMRNLTTRKVDYVIEGVAGYRYAPEGGALMQLYLGGIHGQTIIKSHFGHNSVVRAKKWSVDGGADWPALESLSRRVRNYIRRAAVARVPGRPILAGAATLWQQGYPLKEMARSPYHWEAQGLYADA